MSDTSVTQQDVQDAERRENEILQQALQQHLQQRVVLLSAEVVKVRAALEEANARNAQLEQAHADAERAEIERLAQEANRPEGVVNGEVVGSE